MYYVTHINSQIKFKKWHNKTNYMIRPIVQPCLDGNFCSIRAHKVLNDRVRVQVIEHPKNFILAFSTFVIHQLHSRVSYGYFSGGRGGGGGGNACVIFQTTPSF